MTQPPQRPRQVATGPTNTVSIEDLKSGEEKLDQWIRQLTNDKIGWTHVYAVGSVIPGVGTVFAAMDAIGDLLTLMDDNPNDFLTWVSFGVNVVGLVTFPGVGPARLAIRTTLTTVRKQGIEKISIAMLDALEKNLNDKSKGTIEDFVKAIDTRLSELLEKIAEKIVAACNSFAEMLKGIASEEGQRSLKKAIKTVKKHRYSWAQWAQRAQLSVARPIF